MNDDGGISDAGATGQETCAYGEPVGNTTEELNLSNALNRAIAITNRTDDVAKIGANLRNAGYNVTDDVISEVKQHLFVRDHLIPVPGQSGKFAIGRFGKDLKDVENWEDCASGLNNPDYEDFFKLMRHEYLESFLMREGVPFRGLMNAPELTFLRYGAHELAPNFNVNMFSHWISTNGLMRRLPASIPQVNGDFNQIILQIKNFEGL